MNKKSLAKIIASFVIVLLFSVAISLPVFAEDYGLGATAGAAGLKNVTQGDLPTLIGTIVGTALSLVAVVFFGLMLFGGFSYMMARGKSEETTKAIDTMIGAAVGIIIVLSSYAITNFVLQAVKK